MIPDYAFYVNPEKIIGDSFSLDKDESKHAIQVLRKKVGDKICLINGIGTGYFVVIDSVEKNQVFGSIKETIPENFQTSDYLLEHGMVDMVTPRPELRDTLSTIIHILMKISRTRYPSHTNG